MPRLGNALVYRYTRTDVMTTVMDFDRVYRVFDPFQSRVCMPLHRVAEILAHIGSFV